MSKNNKPNTFWKLITEQGIRIPIIQRDYAQGRLDAKSTQIRKKFIEEIVKSLNSEDNPLHLDFIYGKNFGKLDINTIEKNKKTIISLLKSIKSYTNTLSIDLTYELNDNIKDIDGENEGYFIPIDGQQRLTTLFLLHWYISSKISQNKIADDRLKNFSYWTRPSSKDFCSSLVNNEFPAINNGQKLSEVIEDSTWFLSLWKKDPTVRGMLVTLDEISNKMNFFDDAELKKSWEKITQRDCISFEYLDLEKFELTDELYIKMNARGKHLSDFENFKTWLIEYIQKNKIEIKIDKWQTQIDIAWTDVFWKYKVKNVFDVDKEYLSFFNAMALYFFIENIKIDKDKDGKNKIKDDDKIVIECFRTGSYIPLSRYIELDTFNSKNLNFIFTILESIKNNGVRILENVLNYICGQREPNNILNKLIGKDNISPNYWDRTYLYALVRYIYFKDKNIEYYSQDELQRLKHWLRLTKNLIYNTTIDTQEGFHSAISAVNELVSKLSLNCDDIYTIICKLNKPITFLSTNQYTEESRKLKIISEYPDLEQIIVDTENHEYFYGQINFILEFSENENGEFDVLKFKKYSKSLCALFDNKILNSNDYILQRALLSKGDYLIRVGSNYGFCESSHGTLRNREENWRRLFNNEQNKWLLKEIIDDVDFDLNQIEFSLIKIILKSPQKGWMQKIIETPKAISYCSKLLIRYNDENRIMLLGSSTMSGYHSELFTYCFFKKFISDNTNSLENVELFKPFGKIHYVFIKGKEHQPRIIFEQLNYKQRKSDYLLEVIFNPNKVQYELYFHRKSGEYIDEIILNIIKHLSFSKNISNDSHVSYSKFVNSDVELKIEIDTFISSMQDLKNKWIESVKLNA